MASTETHVSRVIIDDLFELYSYDLIFPKAKADSPSLALLYGDNGCGKTTILQLLFHLLSPRPNRGHRSFLGNTSFRRFEVRLGAGQRVLAERETARIGDFSIRYSDSSGDDRHCSFKQDRRGHVAFSRPLNEDFEHAHFIQFLENLSIQFYHLGDDRRLVSDSLDDGEVPHGLKMRHSRALARASYGLVEGLESRESRSDPLESAMDRFEQSVRAEAFEKTSKGTNDANSVYLKVIRQLATPSKGQLKVGDGPTLESEFEFLSRRYDALAQFGLAPRVDVARFRTAIRSVDEERREVVESILRPHVNGLKARLAALDKLERRLRTFLNHLNKFFTDKRVSFSMAEGVQIVSAAGTHLSNDQLSSGERHLLLLLSTAFGARNQASIFVIDEPEISLNVKWQRRLVGALLDCMAGSNAQFILATHSLEITSQYNQSVVELRTSAAG